VLLSLSAALAQITADPSRINVKPRTAILELQVYNKMPDDDIQPVIKQFYREMANTGRYSIIERTQVQRLVDELGPDKSMCNDPECAANIGRALGVEKVVYGDVTKVEIIYEFSISVVDVATGAVERTHTEKVAGNMNDVATVGAMCAVQALHAEKQVSDYKKGDWHRVRAQGIGGRINVVLPSLPDTVRNAIDMQPTIGGGLHYDAMFRMKNGAEFHYTPNVEFWIRQGISDDTLRSTTRFAEVAFNVADFRYFFSAPTEKNVVFYLGLGPTWVLDIIYDEYASQRWPKDSVTKVYDGTTMGFAVNIMAGIEHMMKNGRWLISGGFKAKLWDPSVFNLSIGLTRQLKKREKKATAEEAPQPQVQEPAAPAEPLPAELPAAEEPPAE